MSVIASGSGRPAHGPIGSPTLRDTSQMPTTARLPTAAGMSQRRSSGRR